MSAKRACEDYHPFIMVIILAVALLFLAASYVALNSMEDRINRRMDEINTSLSKIYDELDRFNKSSVTGPVFVEVSELCSNPQSYEGRLVATVGEIHRIVMVPEIRLPYNMVLASGGNSLGVLTSLNVEEGSKVFVKGVVTKGFQERLEAAGWVKDRELYYILAIEIEEA